jgi:three-Cys-motif partner protein
MSTATFFSEQTEQSRTKARIVSDYFDAWSRIIEKEARRRGLPIGYLDLFAGRGEYKDGAESTPLLVLRKAIANPRVRDLLEAKFNEADPGHAAALRAAIARLPGLSLLRVRPKVYTEVVDTALAARFEAGDMPPVLTFADPFGYKGLTQRLIRAVLRGWGSEVVLFFNFNRVNAGVTNPCVEQHIDELFGPDEAAELRRRVGRISSPAEREQAVLDHLVRGLHAVRGRYAVHFAFTNRDGNRTSHHLLHVTKHERGYHVMKDIMARASSWSEDGVASFRCGPPPGPSLFADVDSPLDELKRLLLTDYAGRAATVGELWRRHSLGRPFTQKNYRDAVRELEGANQVVVECPADRKRARHQLPDWLVVHFPPRPRAVGTSVPTNTSEAS